MPNPRPKRKNVVMLDNMDETERTKDERRKTKDGSFALSHCPFVLYPLSSIHSAVKMAAHWENGHLARYTETGVSPVATCRTYDVRHSTYTDDLMPFDLDLTAR